MHVPDSRNRVCVPRGCVQAAFEASLGCPTPAELLRQVLALANEANEAAEAPSTREEGAGPGAPATVYGSGMATLPDDEDEEAQGLAGFSALESVGGPME